MNKIIYRHVPQGYEFYTPSPRCLLNGVPFSCLMLLTLKPVGLKMSEWFRFKELILKMSSSQIIKNAEAIISIDARGFIFGSAISLQASKPMIVARKPGKLPGELFKEEYSLEYGENSLSVQKKALQKYKSYAIVDDLLQSTNKQLHQ